MSCGACSRPSDIRSNGWCEQTSGRCRSVSCGPAYPGLTGLSRSPVPRGRHSSGARAIRGATQLDADERDHLLERVSELVTAVLARNQSARTTSSASSSPRPATSAPEFPHSPFDHWNRDIPPFALRSSTCSGQCLGSYGARTMSKRTLTPARISTVTCMVRKPCGPTCAMATGRQRRMRDATVTGESLATGRAGVGTGLLGTSVGLAYAGRHRCAIDRPGMPTR